MPGEKGAGVITERSQEPAAPLFLHLLEGMFREVERMAGQAAAAEAELKRLHTRVTFLEAELAQLRSQSTRGHEEWPPGRFDQLRRRWTVLRGGFRDPVGARRA